MIFVQNRQTATKRNYSYGAKQFVYFGQKWHFWSRRVIYEEV